MNLKSAWMLCITVFLLTVGCDANPEEQFAEYRSAIKRDLLDPASAEFRDEKIRTLWNEQGSRLKIYCADVNGHNAVGGKTGFKPVIFVISAKALKDDKSDIFLPGKFWIEDRRTAHTYLMCDRPDTQRSNGDLFMVYASPNLDDKTKRWADEESPVLSNLSAPENR